VTNHEPVASSICRHIGNDFRMMADYTFGPVFWQCMGVAVLLFQIALFSVLVITIINCFETAEPSHPWMPRRLAVRRGFFPVLALAATAGLALAGARAVSDQAVPVQFWYALPPMAVVGWIAAYHALRHMRKDILGITAIDSLLVAAPATATVWLAAVGYWTSSIPAALGLFGLMAAVLLFIIPRKGA
jgi:hypothetical protein